MIAEFEADLARARAREGMAIAKAKGRLRGKQPKLKPAREAQLVALWHAGNHTTLALALALALAEMFDVARSTVYRAIQRGGPPAASSPATHQPSPGERRGLIDNDSRRCLSTPTSQLSK